MSLKQRINHKRWRFQKRQKMFTVWKTQNGRRIPVYKIVFNPEIQTVMIAELKIRGMLHCLNSAY